MSSNVLMSTPSKKVAYRADNAIVTAMQAQERASAELKKAAGVLQEQHATLIALARALPDDTGAERSAEAHDVDQLKGKCDRLEKKLSAERTEWLIQLEHTIKERDAARTQTEAYLKRNEELVVRLRSAERKLAQMQEILK